MAKKDVTKKNKDNGVSKESKNLKKQNVSKPSNKKDLKRKDITKTLEKEDLKKKEVKKQTIERAKRDLHFEQSDGADEFSKLAKIVLIVTLIIVVFYFITTFVTRKANAIRTVRNIKNDEKAEIQYDSLIIGSMLKIDGSYYVLIEKDGDEKLAEYQTLLQTIAANDEAPKVYTANLTDSFNKNYLASESNYESDLSKFKVSGTTLVKVSDHKIESTYDNYEAIVKELEGLK